MRKNKFKSHLVSLVLLAEKTLFTRKQLPDCNFLAEQ